MSRPAKVRRQGLPARTILYVGEPSAVHQVDEENAARLWRLEKELFRDSPRTWSIITVATPGDAIQVLEAMTAITHVIVTYVGYPPGTIAAWTQRLSLARPHVAIIGVWRSSPHRDQSAPKHLAQCGIDAWLSLDDVDTEALVRAVEVDTMTAGRRRVENLTARVRTLQEELVLLDAALERAEVTQPPTVNREIDVEERHA
jgi:hypothetical protein